MNEECLICGAPLEYLEEAIPMECAVCHRKEDSRTRCVHGHYVCDECHTAGLDAVLGLCLEETSRDPIEILERMMALPFCHMHGPEHHVMAGAALLTACRNAGGEVDLARALPEMLRRGKAVPGEPAASGAPAVRGSVPEYTCPFSPGPPPCRRRAGAWPIR